MPSISPRLLAVGIYRTGKKSTSLSLAQGFPKILTFLLLAILEGNRILLFYMADAPAEQVQEVTTVQEVPAAQKVVKTTKVVPPPVKTDHPQKVYEEKKVIFRTYQIIWYVVTAIEFLLLFRIALKAIGANPASGFASLIYAISEPFAFPFIGILGTTVSRGAIFEWTSIIAMIVYGVLAYGLVQLFQLLKPVTPQEVSEGVDNP